MEKIGFLNEYNMLTKKIELTKKEIGSMGLISFGARKRAKIKLQALEEAQRDITTTYTASGSIVSSDNKNRYKTYSSQVQAAYEMFNAESNYGAEICKGVISTRVSFIGGEGLSVIAVENKEAQDFIDDFLEVNKLNGSRLIKMLTTGELEGKNLIILSKDKDNLTNKQIIKIKTLSWYYNNYKIISDPLDNDNVLKIIYKKNKNDIEEKTIDVNSAVYVKLGGMFNDINLTTNKLHCILTDMENFSRAKYDLRENTHLFGRYMPYWKVQSMAEAKSINADLGALSWEPGTAYAGTGDFSIVEPSGSAAKSIIDDMLTALKCISITLGIPIHFLAYPELMSNRATADNLMELVVASTKQDRLIWEESFKIIIKKAMMMMVAGGFLSNDAAAAEIQVKLPVISLALMQQIIDIWYPLLIDNRISNFTFLNMLPGINPSEEIKLIDDEKKKRMIDSPFNNNTTNQSLNDLKNNNNNE